MIICASSTYSAIRLVRRSSHGPFEDVRRGLRRGARRRHPARLARPRRRHPGDDEDGPDLLDPLREREGRLEGPLHHVGREPRGSPGRDDGPRHDRPGRHGVVHPRCRPDPAGAQGRGAHEELARRPPEVHRPAGAGEHVRLDRPGQPRGAVQPEPLEQPPPRALPLLRLPEVPARDVLPDLRGPVREPRQTVVVRRRVPRGRDPVSGAGRPRRRGRPAAPPVREDGPPARRQSEVFWRSLRSASAYFPASFSLPNVFVAAALFSSIASTVFTSTWTTSFPGARRNRAAIDAPSPVITTSRPTGRCRTYVPFARRSDSRRIISATSGWSRYAVSPAFARTSRPFRRITRASALDSLCPAASSDQNAAWRESARSRRRRAVIASRSWLRTSSFRVASTSFASFGCRRCRNVWNSWLNGSSSGGERPRDGATGEGISVDGSLADGSLADKDGTSCSIRSTASAKLLSGWRSIASMTTLPWPSSSQRSSFRAASSRLAIPSRRAQRTAATKAFLPKSGFGE